MMDVKIRVKHDIFINETRRFQFDTDIKSPLRGPSRLRRLYAFRIVDDNNDGPRSEVVMGSMGFGGSLAMVNHS